MFTELYQKGFIPDNFHHWDNYTFIIYALIIIYSIFISKIIERHRSYSGKINTFELYCIAILPSLILFSIRGYYVGQDTPEYYRIFENTDVRAFEDMEVGFLYLNRFLHFLLPNSQVGMFVLSQFFLIPVFSSIWKSRNYIDISISFASFFCIFYLQSFNLLRINIAAAIIVYGFKFILKNDTKKFLLTLLVAVSIHYSAISLFLPVLFYFYYQKHPKQAIIVFLIFFAISISLGSYLMNYIFIGRYLYYSDINSETSLGYMAFFEYVPVFYILYLILKKKLNATSSLDALFVSIALFGFYFRILAYYVSMAGRIYTVFMTLFVIFIPLYALLIKNKNRKLYKRFYFTYLAYLLIRLHIYFSSMLSSDGLMPYYTIFDN